MTQNPEGEGRPARHLPESVQVLIVAAAGAGALIAIILVFGLATPDSRAAPPPAASKPAAFVPTQQQLAALDVQAVSRRIFHTEIVTEGTIVPNGGLAASGSSGGRIKDGLPILAGQSSDLLQAENDLTTAKTQYQLAATNEKREHALYTAEGAALKDWQQSQSDLATAATALSAARNKLRMLGKSDAEIAASGAVFSVGNQSTLWLIANVREADSALVRRGDRARVRVAALPGGVFDTAIAYVASVIDPATHRLVVGAPVQNADGRLKPNMLASFTILAGPATDAPAVPQKAIVYEGDKARVWVVGSNNAISLREISVGRTNDGYVEVTRGLSPGTRIVMSGALFIDRAASNE